MESLFRARFLLRGLAALALLLLLVAAFVWCAAHLTSVWWWLGLAVLAVILLGLARRAARWVPRRVLLEVDFERGVVEQPAPRTPLSLGADRPLALRDVVDALARAAGDRRVEGLVARIGSFRPGLAAAEELRDAVLAFRASGKHAIAWSETLGEGRSASVETYFAAAFDEVFVQPTGEVGLDGVLADQPFVKGALDKVGVEPLLDHRREYKAAKNLFTETEMTAPHRESVQALVDDQVEILVAGIAEGRGLDPARVRALIDEGPFHASQALAAGLVDGLAYRDEVYAAATERLGGRLLLLPRYLARAGRPRRRGASVALVSGVGSIARGPSRPRSARSGPVMGSDDVAWAIRKAAKARRVKAIVLRVDSPGGSAVASDVVWREVVKAREGGTPVVCSMGNVAASGGYYVACAADAIVAQPGTITGSIGVVWGKFYLREAWRRLGVTWDGLKVGEHADLWSTNHAFDDGGWAKVRGLLDAVYDDFVTRVAEGRGMSKEAVEAVAKGRVWTGAAAAERGLVDHLGGLGRALEVAAEVAGLPAGTTPRVRVVARRRRLLPWRQPESTEAALRALAVGAGIAPPEGRLALPPLGLSTGAR